MSRVYDLVDRVPALPNSKPGKYVAHGKPEATKEAGELLTELGKMKLPDGWIPNFVLVNSPENYLKRLKQRVDLIAQGFHPSSTRFWKD